MSFVLSKTKVITLAKQKGERQTVNQSKLEVITCSVADVKCGKTRADESRLVLVFFFEKVARVLLSHGMISNKHRPILV